MSETTNAALPVPSAPIAGNLLVTHAWRYFFLQLFVRTGGSSGPNISLLQAQVAALQGNITSLLSEVAVLTADVSVLNAQTAALTASVNDLNALIVAGSMPL